MPSVVIHLHKTIQPMSYMETLCIVCVYSLSLGFLGIAILYIKATDLKL